MDANYIINRLKSTTYKYSTVDIMRTRLNNIDEHARHEIILNLKMELMLERNADIREALTELLYRIPIGK